VYDKYHDAISAISGIEILSGRYILKMGIVVEIGKSTEGLMSEDTLLLASIENSNPIRCNHPNRKRRMRR
jgi:hypothetical protein